MTALPVLARQLLVFCGFGLAIFAPLGVVVAATPANPPTSVAQCNGGEEPDTFTTTCVPFMTPKTPGASATTTSATTCPQGVSGSECGTQGGGVDAANPLTSEAERMATNTEQIGEDVAAGTADDA
ncbi:hypothetical protein ACIA48_27445 [Mycobacterium sp. NPDC051804]|uniref:hypothetical protein n=1 Tax=Mycobacterium sp. NPDC051804 TaxID=3364295 RepID=UPI0037A70409